MQKLLLTITLIICFLPINLLANDENNLTPAEALKIINKQLEIIENTKDETIIKNAEEIIENTRNKLLLTAKGDCSNLEPFNNLDELLYQFYSNLDSDCLFKMSIEELEEIWDTKIMDDSLALEDYGNINYYSTFAGKPYKTEKDAFYIEVFKSKENIVSTFNIHVTEEYFAKHNTLLPDGNFPKLLSDPLKISKFYNFHNDCSYNSLKPKNILNNDFFPYTYYWYNSNKTRIIFLHGCYRIYKISVNNWVTDSFIVVEKKYKEMTEKITN